MMSPNSDAASRILRMAIGKLCTAGSSECQTLRKDRIHEGGEMVNITSLFHAERS